MRIWLAPSAFAPHRGGVEELTHQLARELEAQGHEVLVVTHRFPATLPELETVEGVQTRRIDFVAPAATPRGLARFARGAGSVQRSLDALGPAPDVINVQCVSVQALHFCRYARRRSVPLVVTTQGEVAMDAQGIFEHSAYMRFSLRTAARRARALTACSLWAAEAAARVAPGFSGARVIPNAVDPEQWDVGEPPAEPVLCAWGRQVPQKGFELAISAFAFLRERVPAARLLIAGDGPERERLRALAGPGIEFVGPVDRAGVRALLARSRVALVPSRVEPFGIVALEALAAGRGLVYASATGLASAAGGLGRAVAVDDAPAFAEAMEAELRDPTPAAAGRSRAQELSWSVIAARYSVLYEEAAQGPPRARRTLRPEHV